ncbi:C-type lectin domain family 4 member F-like isoform X3 [Limanda limanda]|uniref:C-type lectin domain family 4 member F-like isoform X3 n=1 Tax=Limanda limanda TaxID=27771 RepID=UPI0029C6EDE0|nr:C-type lectin domain family 4 member F-like isoform X3 [Limanda limanda]
MTCHMRMKEQDESDQWINEPQPVPVSRFRRWIVPAVAVTVVLVLIINLGVSYVTTSNHLWSVETRVSNLSNVIESLSASLQNAQVPETVGKAQLLHSAVEDRLTSDVTMSNRLQSVETRVSNLSNVIESLSASLQNAQDVTTSNRLRSVETRVSNLSNVIESLSASLQNAQETVGKAQLLHSAVEDRLTSDVTMSNRLQSVETRVSNLSNVIESLSASLQNAQDVTTSNRLRSVETRVSNLSNVIESLSASLQNAQETVEKAQLLHSDMEDRMTSDVTTSNRLRSVETRVSNLSNVIESLSASLQNAQDVTTSNRLRSVETRVSNLSNVIESLSASLQNTQDVTTSNRLWSVETRVSNLSNVIESLSASLQNAQDVTTSNRLRSVETRVSNLSNVIESLSASLQNAQETVEKAQLLHSAMEDRLTSVLEALKQLSAIDSLSSLTSIKCSLEQILNNSTGLDGCCPPDWKLSGLSCYFFSRSPLSWNDSRAWCEDHESHLVILSSDKDWDFVTRHIGSEFFWVGLSDWRTGTWEWVDQTPYPMDSRQWRPGQPDNWDGHGHGDGGEDCAHLHMDGRLNDQHCSKHMWYICQKRKG